MPLDISIVEDAWLSGALSFEEFLMEFEAKWNAPVMRMAGAAIIDQLPPEVHAELRRTNKDAYDRAMKEVQYGQTKLQRVTDRRGQATPTDSAPPGFGGGAPEL
jgi:hypothetical protein